MSSTVSMPLTSSKLSSSFMLTHCASYMPDRQPKPSNHHHCPYQILPKPPKTPLNRPHALLFGVLRLYRQDFPNETSPHFFLIAFGCVREREGKVLKNELIFQGRSLNAKTRRQINGSQSFKLLFSSSLRYFLRVLGEI